MKIPVKKADGQVVVYRLGFQHRNRQPSGRMKMDLPRHNEDWNPRHTTCIVEGLRPDNQLVYMSTGMAIFSEEEDFVKEKGRKVALARAIRDLPRETRACIWAGYLYRYDLPAIESIAWSPIRQQAMLKWKESSWSYTL